MEMYRFVLCLCFRMDCFAGAMSCSMDLGLCMPAGFDYRRSSRPSENACFLAEHAGGLG